MNLITQFFSQTFPSSEKDCSQLAASGPRRVQRNCTFTGCTFINVGLATDEAFVREIDATQVRSSGAGSATPTAAE